MNGSKLGFALLVLSLGTGLVGCAKVGQPAVVAKEQAAVESVAERVKASLVRIKVVSPEYYEGREQKSISFGSGSIISADGYVITNHHVAGKAVGLVCTMPNREEIPAILIGTDAATDIAVIKLQPSEPTTFPFVEFGDSDQVRVGDRVLALGSPVALSQSVTMGIIANTAMITPPTFGNYEFELDGEVVGDLVRWIGHDAAIFPGNSGGPLVNLEGQIIGVNEIGLGLGGAIPGNLAKSVAEQLIADGNVSRAYLGMMTQPLLRRSGIREGVLVNTVVPKGPAEGAGLLPGDIVLAIAGTPIEGRFAEDLPGINQLVANLPVGQPSTLLVKRDGEEKEINVTPTERQPAFIPETELREWGMSASNLSAWTTMALAREGQDGVLVTSLRSGGPLAKAKPELREADIILEVNGQKITRVADLTALTETLGSGEGKFVPVLVKFEREAEELLSVVEIGIDQLKDPGREVTKGWLPIETQVVTRELAKLLGQDSLKGVRVTRLYQAAGTEFALKPGDILTHLDGEPIEAARKEDADVFETMLRQYRAGTKSELTILRDGAKSTAAVTIASSPAKAQEMRRYRNLDFEIIVREASFRDSEKPQFEGVGAKVLVDTVTQGGWAFLAGLQPGDAVLSIDGATIATLADVQLALESAQTAKAPTVVLYVRRGATNQFVEIETKW
jgi:serine protease Do